MNNQTYSEVEAIDCISENNCTIEFQKNKNSDKFLVIYFTKKGIDTSAIGIPQKKYNAEIEIHSGSKLFYKKDIPVYKEKDKLFFVLLLQINYLKTLTQDGITEIDINNKYKFILSKKEARRTKELANCLLN